MVCELVTWNVGFAELANLRPFWAVVHRKQSWSYKFPAVRTRLWLVDFLLVFFFFSDRNWLIAFFAPEKVPFAVNFVELH